jgi:hypothetical protein
VGDKEVRRSAHAVSISLDMNSTVGQGVFTLLTTSPVGFLCIYYPNQPLRRNGLAADTSWLWMSVNLPEDLPTRRHINEWSNPPGTQIFRAATGRHFSRIRFGTRRRKGEPTSPFVTVWGCGCWRRRESLPLDSAPVWVPQLLLQ